MATTRTTRTARKTRAASVVGLGGRGRLAALSVAEAVPAWTAAPVTGRAKYLGFWVGPDAEQRHLGRPARQAFEARPPRPRRRHGLGWSTGCHASCAWHSSGPCRSIGRRASASSCRRSSPLAVTPGCPAVGHAGRSPLLGRGGAGRSVPGRGTMKMRTKGASCPGPGRVAWSRRFLAGVMATLWASQENRGLEPS